MSKSSLLLEKSLDHPIDSTKRQPKQGFMSIQIVLEAFNQTFTPLLQHFMIQAGYEEFETETISSAFVDYYQMVVLRIAEYLKSLKLNHHSQDLNEEEMIILLHLKELQVDPNPKMFYAINLFINNFPLTLQQVMVNANFSISECQENRQCYIETLSKGLIMLNQVYLNYKRRRDEIANNPSTVRVEMSETESYTNSNSSYEAEKIELIYSSAKHEIYHVQNGHLHLTLKVFKFSSPRDKEILSLSNEYKNSRLLCHPAIRKPYNRSIYQERKALELEWVNGSHLDVAYDKVKHDIPKFLEIAREIVSGVFSIHNQNIMHLSLSGEHILYDAETSAVKIIGFGSSASFDCNLRYISNEELHDSNLYYLSPEQSGRMNRDIDYRSDFYSLGVLFYRLLLGRFPFESDNALKFIRLHMFQEIPTIVSKNPNIPNSVSDMVKKLMEKEASKRYQSAKGILHDLDLMISEYNADAKLTSIELGAHDYPNKLLFSHKIYGRSSEFEELKACFNRVVEGTFELCFVGGKSGYGKSCFISELNRNVMEQFGFFCHGKFRKSELEPFSGLIEAITNFCSVLLLEETSKQDKFKSKIQQVVKQEGKILTELVHNLHLIIGEQDAPCEAFGNEAKNRFNYVFLKFFRAICSYGVPIVMALEDLQWIDEESASFLSVVFRERPIKNLMIIGTYRSNEVNDNHRTVQLMDEAKSNNLKITMIELEQFNKETVNNIVSEILHISPFESYPLTAFLHRKTKGNPFFLFQAIMMFVDKGLIFYNEEKCLWQWDKVINDEHNISEDVIGLLRNKIQGYSESTRNVLIAASCLGKEISLLALQRIADSEMSVKEALSTGMITLRDRDSSHCFFVHDSIQEAAFSFCSQNLKSTLLQFGRKLMLRLTNDEQKQNIFTISNLFLQASDLLDSLEEKIRIAELFLLAGRSALRATAVKKALELLEKSIALISREENWKNHYNLTLDIHNSAIEAACCAGDEIRITKFARVIAENAKSMFDLAHAIHMQIRLYNDKRNYEASIQTGFWFLNCIKEKLYSDEEVKVNFERVAEAKKLVYERTDEDIINGKICADKEVLAMLSIMNVLSSSAFFAQPELFLLIAANMVKLTFEYGLSKYSAHGFSLLGVVLFEKDIETSFRLGKLASKMLKKNGSKEFFPSVTLVYNGILSTKHHSIHQSIEPLKEAYRVSLEIGNYELSVNCAATFVQLYYFSGRCLDGLQRIIEELNDGLRFSRASFSSIHQSVLNLRMEGIEKPAMLIGEVFNFDYVLNESNDAGEKARCLVLCFIMAYLFNEDQFAFTLLQKCRPFIQILSHSQYIIPFLFYDGLISIAIAKQTGSNIEKENGQKCIDSLEGLAAKSPENFMNKYYLLQAEFDALNSDESNALSNFDQSIDFAHQNEFPHEEALACERAGIFLLKTRSFSKASQYLERSYFSYLRWGGNGKAKHLLYRYGVLREKMHKLPGAIQANEDDIVSLITEDFSFSMNDAVSRKRARIE